MHDYQYHTLREQIEGRLAAAVKLHESEVASLDHVWRMANDCDPPAHESEAEPVDQFGEELPVEEQERIDLGVSDAVRELLPELPRGFTYKTVVSELMRKHGLPAKQRTVMQVLRRCVELNMVRVDEKGSGKRATHYSYLTSIPIGNGKRH